jgi:hypothetical protein
MVVEKSLRLCLVLIGTALAGPVAMAEQIYHWVDEQGVNHYSQSPPPVVASPVETLEVDGSQPASYDPNEDRYNVAAQAEAMQALRDEMAESRKNRQQVKPSSGGNTVIYYPEPENHTEILYPPGYRPRPPRPRPPGNRPDRPPRPDTPPVDAPPASKPFRPR